MHPVLIQIGPVRLFSFGLMVIVGFLAGLWLATRLARSRGLAADALSDAAVVILFASIAGARLLHVLLDWKQYGGGHLLEVGALWQGGMSFHGGAVGGIAAGMLFMRARRLPILPMADAAIPGLALGYAIGRVGCLLNGCCYGGPTELAWGIPGQFCRDGDPSLHYHPAQLYASAANLLLCGLLVLAYRRPHRVGQVLALYVAGYSAYRFLIEALRKGVTAEVLAFGLTTAQVFSLAAIAASMTWWAWLGRRSEPVEPLDFKAK